MEPVKVKKVGLINGPLSAIIAHLGHSDTVTIADAGLPVPASTQRIDLALKHGVPGFLETLETVLNEMFVEKAYVSEEILTYSPQIYDGIKNLLIDIVVEAVPHKEFKEMTQSAKAIVRTGEFTPYANIILVAGAWGFNV
jgi:D-ribose pyranase